MIDGFSEKKKSPRGFALVLVLIVVAMISLSAYTLCSRLVVEHESTQLHGLQLQSRMMVDSGVTDALMVLEQPPSARSSLGGTFNNPTRWQGQLVVDHREPRGRGRFAIVAPMPDEFGYPAGWRFGLQDESVRLNLNALTPPTPTPQATGGTGGTTGAPGGAGTTGGGGAPSGATTGGGGAPGNGGAATSTPAPTSTTTGGGTGAGNASGSRSNNPGGSSSSTTSTGSNAGGASGTANNSSTEASSIDTSPEGRLMRIPGMTIDVAHAILDWIDTDNEPREYGAESDYYSSLMPPYEPRNGPLETIEELLSVRGVTPEMLFGRDVNRNGMIDVQEQSLVLQTVVDDGSGAVNFGWSAFLTVYSQERNTTDLGYSRIDLNASNLQQLYNDLAAVTDPTWATFICAYRQRGPYAGNDPGTAPVSVIQLNLNQQGNTKLTDVLDLVGAKIQAPVQGATQGPIVASPFAADPVAMSTYLPKLMELCTVGTSKAIAGRININQASRSVLLTIPGLTEEVVDMIISQREMEQSDTLSDMQHETWLLSRGIVTLAEMKRLRPYVTAGGDVYRTQVIGYFDAGEIASRVEVVLDATSAIPRLVSWRDISHLGRGFAREILGVNTASAMRDAQ